MIQNAPKDVADFLSTNKDVLVSIAKMVENGRMSDSDREFYLSA
jgi:hypothetical protein